VTRRDGEQLMRAKKADRQVHMNGRSAAIDPERPDLKPFYVDARATTADFFDMFRVPFLAGQGWSAADDEQHKQVAVISKKLAEKVFGSTAVVGKSIRVESSRLQIVGVIEDWVPAPHFYDLNTGSYGVGEQLFVPFETAIDVKMSRDGSMDCFGPSEDVEAVGSPCVWTQFWVELDSGSSSIRRQRSPRTRTSSSTTPRSSSASATSSGRPTFGSSA
jgi:putative ABC transport system permease protein